MQRKRLLYLVWAKGLLGAALVAAALAACEREDDPSDPYPRAVRAITGPALMPFKLDGETDVKNVKLTWRQRSKADRYDIYRDDVFAGSARGDTFDDYGLAAGSTYNYVVKAYTGEVQEAESARASVTLPDASALGTRGQLWDNAVNNGNSINTGSGAFLINGKYYQYSAAIVDHAVQVTETSSSDGKTFGSPIVFSNTTGNTADGSKLESAQFRQVNNKVILTGHYDNSGYTVAQFFLGVITPGAGKFDSEINEKPCGNASRDQSLFIDADGRAYALCATTTDMGIYRLAPDWTDFDMNLAFFFKGAALETPFIVRKGEGEYYFFGSIQSGWYPSRRSTRWEKA